MTQDERSDHIGSVLFDVTYPAREYVIGVMGDGHYIQVEFEADGEVWRGRKWYISPHAIDAEIVQTWFKACLTSLEHELRESFKYKRKAIFGPHYDLDQLVAIADCTVSRPAL